MPAVRTERIRSSDLNFDYGISVSRDGLFSTTLPAEIAEKLRKSGVDLNRNRIGNEGYFCSDTYKGVKAQVLKIVEEYHSRTEIDSRIVILYTIETTCSYCLTADGDIAPNGMEFWTKIPREGLGVPWKSGTTGFQGNRPAFVRILNGLQFVAIPFRKVTYRYRSGAEKSEYLRLEEGDYKEGSALHYLVDIRSPNDDGELKEMDYTEERALFFVNMFKAIARINERIRDFIEPDKLVQAIDNHVKLLS